MISTDNSLSELRHIVKRKLSEKRYLHTLGVERMACYLGDILMPEKVRELSVAALLHDIAKEMTWEEHISLIKNSDIACDDNDLSTKPALHSLAAVPLIKQDYSEYSSDDILSAVANHTLGAPGMSLFDEIIFISDYAEDGRTYPVCVEVNNFIKENIRKEKTFFENEKLLHRATLMAIESTISSLNARGERVNPKTLLTKRFIKQTIENN